MDNIFELLPFIIGILYFVFGVGKKKKNAPKKRSPQTNSPERTATSLEEILRELSGEVKKTTPVPSPVPPTAASPYSSYEEKPKQKEYEPTSASTPFVDEYNHAANTGRPLAEIKEEILLGQQLEQGVDIDFDLRQAVINEALLNRPYS